MSVSNYQRDPANVSKLNLLIYFVWFLALGAGLFSLFIHNQQSDLGSNNSSSQVAVVTTPTPGPSSSPVAEQGIGAELLSSGGSSTSKSSVSPSSSTSSILDNIYNNYTELTPAPTNNPVVLGVNTSSIATVDASGVGQYTSVAVGSDGYARISYYDNTHGDLKYARCTNSACTTSNIVTIDSLNTTGQFTSMKLGTNGFARIAYYYQTGNSLRFVQCGDDDCSLAARTVNTVDTNGGNYASMALVGDLARIAYTNGATDSLVYIQCTNQSCSTHSTRLVMISSVVNMGYISLTLGQDGFPRIAFSYGFTGVSGSHYLFYMRCGNDSCSSRSFTTIDSTVADTGEYASIAIGSDGFSRISYYDSINHDLKYAQCTNDNCTAGTVIRNTLDSFGATGLHTSIKIGSDGNARISYNGAVTGSGTKLKYATCLDVACSNPIIDVLDATSTNVGFFTSLIFGSDGLARVSYYDATNNALKLWVEAPAPSVASYYYSVAPASGTAGSPSSVFTVGAKDTSGNVVSVLTDTTVYLYSSGAGGIFATSSGGSYTATSVTIPAGGTTADFYYKNNTAGTYTLTASDQTPSPTPDSGIANATTVYTVNAAALTKFVFSPTTASATAATPTSALTITARDVFNNAVNVASSTTLTLTDGIGGGQFSLTSTPFNPTAIATINAGSSTVVVYYRNSTVGTYNLVAHNDSLTDATATVTVTPAALSSYYFTTAPASGNAGAPSSVFTVTAYDPYGNIVTVAANTTVYLYSTSVTGTFATTSGGPFTIHSITILAGNSSAGFYYQDATHGVYTLTASDQTPSPTPDTGINNATTTYTVNAVATPTPTPTATPTATPTSTPTITPTPTATPSVGPLQPLTGRQVILSSSRIMDPSAAFSWHAGVTATIKAIRLQLCDNPSNLTTCVLPVGASLSSSTLLSTGGQLGSGWTYAINSAQEVLLTKAAGAAVTFGGAESLTIDNLVNPTTFGTFYFRLTTYSDVSTAPATSLEYGAFVASTARSLTITGDVAESLIFRVANTVAMDCSSQTDIPDPNDAASDLVTLSPNTLSSLAPSVGTAQICASTNANGGYVITYHDAAYGGVTKGFYDGAHEFAVANLFASTPGTEQFGFNLRANTTPAVGFDPDGSGLVADLINPDYSTVDRFSYDDTGSAVILAAKATSNAAAARYTLSYLANISAVTPGGVYKAHQVFVITATY